MKIFLDTIGCRLNQAEIEAYARRFRAAGHELAAMPEEADLAVVNTCTVTAQAAADSRSTIRRIQRAGVDEILVTGCWSSLNPIDAARLPGVRQVIPNAEKDNLVGQALNIPEETFDLEPVERKPLPGMRMRTRAFIKVQDGCDNRCTFCVTTLARGAGRSRPLTEVLADIHAAVRSRDAGAQEIVLTGVHLGSWGQDFAAPMHLRHLIKTILAETEVPRLRLSSLEPWDLDEGFFELWSDPRLCRHVHLPLQSGCERTLRRMARKTTPSAYAQVVQAARSAAPDIAITTDIIAGFPGEDEGEFEESLEFVRSIEFAGGHVFTYSARRGTVAARMPGQVPQLLRKQRNARLRQSLAESARSYQEGFIGQVLPVLWESAATLGPQGWEMSGLTGNYLRVNAHAPETLWNQITPVRLDRLAGEHIWGNIQFS